MARTSHIEGMNGACWRIFVFSLASVVIFEGGTEVVGRGAGAYRYDSSRKASISMENRLARR